jgi:hypothetical protein
MECAANYEIRSECSVVADDQVFKFKHPKGLYRTRIKNIPRSDYSTPFLLSLHLYFDAPSLDQARDIAEELLADCLNILALATGCKFQRHRIRQVVEATHGVAMKSVLMWSDIIDNEDPQPFLENSTTQCIERLLEFNIPPQIRRAMRWYRLGINAKVPDDQFINFWFALEIVAEFQKSAAKVPSKCPQCQSPLYCESCKTHPIHRPYPKQAIRALIESVDKDCDDETIERLDRTRNGLMHGATLKEIENDLPDPHEHIVDIFGRLLWKALIHQFPREMFDGTINMGFPSTYIHKTFHGIAKMQTVVPVGSDGDLDLDFRGFKATMVPFGPPQSAAPFIINMSPEQHERLQKLSYKNGPHQEMCRRICQRIEAKNGRVYAQVLATDMAFINEALKQSESGEWQNLFRETKGGG